MAVPLRAAPARRVSALPPITVHGPHGFVKQPPAPTRAVALERDPDEAGRHLLDEHGGGHGEVEEEDGLGSGVVLDGEADVAAAVAEQSAGDFAAEGRGDGETGREGEPGAGGGVGKEERGEGEEVEEGAEEGGKFQ